MQASQQERPRRPKDRIALIVNLRKLKLKLMTLCSFPEVALITRLSNQTENKKSQKINFILF